jgi:hypothetical protein
MRAHRLRQVRDNAAHFSFWVALPAARRPRSRRPPEAPPAYGGYAALLERGVPVVLELSEGEKKFGEHSTDGLLVDAEFTGPR